MPDTIYHIALPDGTERQSNAAGITGEIMNGTITEDTPLRCEGWEERKRCGSLPEFQHIFKGVAEPSPSPCPATLPAPLCKNGKKTKPWLLVLCAVLLLLALSGLAQYGCSYIESSAFAPMDAIERGDAEELSRLLQENEVAKLVFEEHGEDLMIIACNKWNAACVNVLLQAGVSPNVEREGVNPLLIACVNKDTESVRLLLNAGANPDKSSGGEIHNVTPLIYACITGQVECVKLLIQAGANVHARADNGMTALDFAIQRGEQECANLLRAAGASY